MDDQHAPATSGGDQLGGVEELEVSAPPTGGPGRWPAVPITGDARSVLQDLIRETEEPGLRQAIRVLMTVIIAAVVIFGSWAWRDIDRRLDDREAEVQQLRVELEAIRDAAPTTTAP